jgi:hypothetical protein
MALRALPGFEAPMKDKPSSRSGSPAPSEFSPGLFVGGQREAVGFEGARFCVLDEALDGGPSAKHVPVYDEAGDRPLVKNLERVVQGMRAAHERGEPVLVFCGHGVRRSPLAAAWYLHRVEGLPLDAAYARIRAVRPQVEEARDWIANTNDLADD